MRRPTVSLLIAVLVALALPACGSASPPERSEKPGRPGGDLALKRVGQFEAPVYVTGAPGFPELLFVVEQPGRVIVLDGGRRAPRPFLDLRGEISYGGEQGLLSIAFP